MPTYKYNALQTNGVKVRGTEESASKASLTTSLEDQGLLLLSAQRVVRVSETSLRRSLFPSEKKIPLETQVLFTRQFATLFKAGVPLLRILYILKDQVEHPSLRNVVAAIAKDIEAGTGLADAFSKHPKTFPPIYCSMLAAGEASGNIASVMEKLCQSMEYEHQVKNLIKGALQYPIIVLCALIIAFAIVMGFVIPKFLPLFDQLGGELPLLTQGCVALSTFFTQNGYVILCSILAAITGVLLFNRTDKGRLALATATLKIPLVGRLLTYSYMARFSALLAILQSSGILIVDSLKIVSNCINNKALQQDLGQLSKQVESGKSISASLNKSPRFPIIMQSMIAIGEASGNLEDMLTEASRHFEVEVHYAVKRLTGALGPILIISMAVAVGFFAMAIYLPIWELTELQMHQK